MSASQTKPLNILLTNSSSMYGGGEFYVLELAQSLLQRGHQTWVSCRKDNLLLEKCTTAGIPTLPLDFPPQGKFVKFVRSLADCIRHNNIHIVHSNANYDRTASAFAARLAGSAHVTNVHSFHSIQHNFTHWVRNHWMTDHFLVDGFCVKELLEQKDRIAGDKISVVYLGVQPETMQRNESLRQRIRSEFGITDRLITIGNVARFVPFKGHSVLLKAFAQLVPRFPDVRLLLVGDGELYQELQQLAKTLGVSSRVFFAGFRDDLQALYSAFDVYVHPSFEGGGETFPFAVLQALAQELPVIVTRVGDVSAMVEDGTSGFVVPDNDPGALAEKLAIVLIDQRQRQEMGKAGLNLLYRMFTLDSMTTAVEQIYRDVLRRRDNRSAIESS